MHQRIKKTKKIKGTFSYIVEVISAEEVKTPLIKSGIADKKTGLVYPPQTYNVAERYAVEKDGEEFFISVGAEINEEDMGDGRIRVAVSFVLICPEDYEDAVFFQTGKYEAAEDNTHDETEENSRDKEEAYSLNDLEHGATDLLFFR